MQIATFGDPDPLFLALLNSLARRSVCYMYITSFKTCAPCQMELSKCAKMLPSYWDISCQ